MLNEAPIITVPGPQETFKGSALLLSTGTSNLISLADADAGTSELLVTISATYGRIGLAQTAGLTIVAGANHSSTVTVAGTLVDLNAAFDGMRYFPNYAFTGTASVQLDVDDQDPLSPPADSALVSITVVAPLAVDDADDPDGTPIAYWKFDNNATDDTGHGYDGTLVGPGEPPALPSFVSGVSGLGFDNTAAIGFNGTYEQYVSVPNLDLDKFFVSAWIRRGNTNDESISIILGGIGSWGIGIVRSDIGGDQDSDTSPYKLYLCHNGYGHVRSFKNIDDTNWHHIAVSYDGSAVTFYIDGVFDRTRSYAPTFNSGGAPYLIGNGSNGNTTNVTIDDLRIYGSPLNAAQAHHVFEGHADAPAADNYATDVDVILGVNVADGVRANDSISVTAITAFDAVSTLGAAVVVNGDGSFTYNASASATLNALPVGVCVADTFTYTVTDGTTSSTATVTVMVRRPVRLEATGNILVGIEQHNTTGIVASFYDNQQNGVLTDYTASIAWGDGVTTGASITPSGDHFYIDSLHPYQRRGLYSITVYINDSRDNLVTVAGSVAAILALDDHTRVQTIDANSLALDKSGSLTQALTWIGANYTIVGAGTYDYTLGMTLVDGLYTSIVSTLTGDLGVTINQVGLASSSTFAPADYTITQTGTVGVNRALTTKDLAGSSTGTELGTITITDGTKTGSGTTGNYTLSTAFTTSLAVTDDGTYDGQSYHSWADIAYPTILTELGAYSTTGNYTETRFEDYSATTTCNETGTIYGDPYTVTASMAGNFSVTEAGNFGTKNYIVTGGGSTPISSTAAYADAAITATSSSGGNPVTSTILKSANWDTGAYTVTTTVNRTSGTANITVTNQGSATASDGTSDALFSATILQLGDYKAGDYTVNVTSTSGGTSTGDFTNQTLYGDTNSSITTTGDSTQTGNVVNGAFDLNITGTIDGTSGVANITNQTFTDGSVTTSILATSTIHRWGNAKTGDYSVSATTSVTGNASSYGENQNDMGAGTTSLTTPTIFTLSETGNTTSGDYTATSVTTGTLTATSLATIQSVNLSNATITSTGTITSQDVGNRKTGLYTIYEESTVTSFTGPFTGSNSGTGFSGTITAGFSHKILDEEGDRSAGTYANTVTIFQNVTIATTGTDPRGVFTATINTITDGVTVLTAGNLRTGQYTADATITITSHSVQAGTHYTDDTTATSTTITHDENNPVTGATVANCTITTTTILNQVGDYLGSTYFTINTTVTTLLTSATVGNSVTTQYTVTSAYSSVDTETHAEGSDTNGDYDFTKTSLSIRSWGETGTILSGAFTRVGNGSEDSTATEFNYYTSGSADFTETISEDFNYTTTGNRVLGTYTDDVTDGTRDTTLTAHSYNLGGWDYTVTQSTLGTFWRYNTGNADGTYAHTEGAADNYTVTQSGHDDGTNNYNYLVTITGTNSYSTDTSGDIYTALFTTTKTGSADNYEMNEAGTHSGGAYTQNIVGEETYTQIDLGNTITGLYTRQITGGGAWTSTNTGATTPSSNGTTLYTWNQTGDPHSGTFTLLMTGTTRYGLLQDFKDISNTQTGQTPGHMNVYPYGQTFVDPNIVGVLCEFGAQAQLGLVPAAVAPLAATPPGAIVFSATIGVAVAIPTGSWIGEQVGRWWFPDRTLRRPTRRERECYDAWLADRLICQETYPEGSPSRAQCYERAANRYSRCLGGQPPRPPLIPRQTAEPPLINP